MNELLHQRLRACGGRRAALAVALALIPASLGTPGASIAAPPVKNVAVTPGDATAWQQPRLAVHPTDPQRLAVAYLEGGPAGICSLALSADGGKSWSTRRIVGGGGAFPRPDGFAECLEAQVAYGPGGRLHYLYEPRNTDHPLVQRRLMITTSPDGGASFPAPQLVDPAGPGVDHSDLWSSMVVDQASGRLYVTWMRYCFPGVPEPQAPVNCVAPLKVVSASSADGGQTFSAPVTVSPPVLPNPARGSTAVDSAGTVYVAWSDSVVADPDNGATLYVTSSRDQGRSFALPTLIDQVDRSSPQCDRLRWTHHSASNGFFHLIAGTLPGQLYLARWDTDPAGFCRVLFQSSRDGGRTWTPPRPVGIRPGGADHQQHRPRLAIGPDGRLHMAYYDIGPDDLQNAYLVTSRDGGLTFSGPERLSTVSSDAKFGPPGENELADYGEWLGIGASTAGVFTAWTDNRRRTAAAPAKQDIFAATLKRP